MHLAQRIQAVDFLTFAFDLENMMMLEVLLVSGASSDWSALPIITPPTTTCPALFMPFALSISLTGVPILTSRFFGCLMSSPFRVVTLEMRGSP